MHVLQGARHIIKTDHPTVVVECLGTTSLLDVNKFFYDIGYEYLYYCSDDAVYRVENVENIEKKVGYPNFIFSYTKLSIG